MMQIKPIIASLRQHRAATTLVIAQVALTMAIVCNAWFIVNQRVAHLSRPSGIDEPNIFIIHNQWTSRMNTREANAAVLRDLDALRHVPGVVDAYADYTYPGVGPMAQLLGMALTPNGKPRVSWSESYYADTHAISALGLKLVAGRNFFANEIGVLGADESLPSPASIIITRALADVLFSRGKALGRQVYIRDKPSVIVSIVERLQVPAVNTNSFAYRSVLLPYRMISTSGGYYIVRVHPGRLHAAMTHAADVLRTIDQQWVIEPMDGVRSYSDLRAEGHAKDRGIAELMSLICLILVGATSVGIFGLTSFWVGQRTRSIGIRRAIGATRGDILRYFQTENFLIVSAGVVLGMALAVLLNLALMRHYELPRLPLWNLPVGAVLLWLLGQLAVLNPALRAANVPPVVATRSV